MAETRHVSVLEKELVEYLSAKEGGDFLDCTFGGGGHALAVLEANPKNTVTAIDRDLRAIERGRKRIHDAGHQVTLHQSPFGQVSQILSEHSFDGIYADLGTSMDQLHENRGFSFHDDSPLDMRMDESQDLTAEDVVNTWGERELFRMFKEGGIGSEARKLVKAIIDTRPISNTAELAKVASRVMAPSTKDKNRHPATTVFQSLRIAVNDEFSEIRNLMNAVPTLVAPKGRFAVISFHSLEDKLVARAMREWQGENAPANVPGAVGKPSLGKLLTRKAVVPTKEEIDRNPSSRSARMRVFEFHN